MDWQCKYSVQGAFKLFSKAKSSPISSFYSPRKKSCVNYFDMGFLLFLKKYASKIGNLTLKHKNSLPMAYLKKKKTANKKTSANKED